MSASSSPALEYLEQLPRQTHTKLYEQPSTVLAVVGMLPHLAKSIVMAMVYMPTPFALADLDIWFKSDAKKEKEQALSVLEQLHIIVLKQDENRKSYYELYKGFKKSLRDALQGSGNHQSFGVPSSQPDPKKVDIAFLDQYAQKQWENVLYFMVASTAAFRSFEGIGDRLGNDTMTLLAGGGLITERGQKITRDGFEFVLKETSNQIWRILLVYLRLCERLDMRETDVLSFIFMLGSLELGQDYSVATLNQTAQVMLDDLAPFGIIYRHSKDSPTFYPTRLATTLISDARALSKTAASSSSGTAGSLSSSNQGFIIVETNYRIYAYTSSLLQIAVISLFCKLTSRFPNLVSGKLTRDSVGRAIKLGISSNQIVEYLRVHAHPQMRGSIHPTVVDQIKLWEYEGERVETTDGYLMKDFGSEAEYRELVNYADSLGILKWRDDKNRRFFIDRMDQMKAYLSRQQQTRQQGRPGGA